MYSGYLENDAFIAISITFALAGAGVLLLFEFSPYAFIRLSLLAIAALAIGALTVAANKAKDEKKKRLKKIIIGCCVAVALLLLSLTITGRNEMSKSKERFTRNVTETTENNIISMGESTTLSGSFFCFGTNDFYIVMQETENGGYLKMKYPCSSTFLYETDAEPYAKTTKVYKEDVLVAKEKLFLPIGSKLGENVERRVLLGVQHEIHIPKGTLQSHPSEETQS